MWVFEVDERDAGFRLSTRSFILVVHSSLPLLLPSSSPNHNFAYPFFSGSISGHGMIQKGVFGVDERDASVRSLTRGLLPVVRPSLLLLLPSSTPTDNITYSFFSGGVYGHVIM